MNSAVNHLVRGDKECRNFLAIELYKEAFCTVKCMKRIMCNLLNSVKEI